MVSYSEIALYLGKSFSTAPASAYGGAVRAMEGHPELCEAMHCFDEALWLIIEEVLNSGLAPDDEESFIHACSLLESRGLKEVSHE